MRYILVLTHPLKIPPNLWHFMRCLPYHGLKARWWDYDSIDGHSEINLVAWLAVPTVDDVLYLTRCLRMRENIQAHFLLPQGAQ